MARHQPEQFVRAEQFPREAELPAITFTKKIIQQQHQNKLKSQSPSPSPSPKAQNLNQLATPMSPPSSPLIYPSSPLSSPDPILNTDFDDSSSSPLNKPRSVSAKEFQSKLPSSTAKYLKQRKKPQQYLQCAAQIVVRCGLRLQDLESYIPHQNLKKLIKYIITFSMNPPSTVPKKNKHVLKNKLWKPFFQRWVINSLIDSGSADVLGHTAKHI